MSDVSNLLTKSNSIYYLLKGNVIHFIKNKKFIAETIYFKVSLTEMEDHGTEMQSLQLTIPCL